MTAAGTQATRRAPQPFDDLTEREHKMVRRIAAKESPWPGHGSGTRVHSQTLERVKRKAYIYYDPQNEGDGWPTWYRPTGAGALAAAAESAAVWNRSDWLKERRAEYARQEHTKCHGGGP